MRSQALSRSRKRSANGSSGAYSDSRPKRFDLPVVALRVDAEAERGAQAVHDVQVVRPGLGPVLPGMHGGVGADVRLRPVGGRPLLVVALERLGVAGPLVAEQLRGKRVEPGGAPDQPVPVVVADLVAEVAQQRAVGLVHGVPDLLALGVVGLLHVDA